MTDFILLFQFGGCRRDTCFASTGAIIKTICRISKNVSSCFRLGSIGRSLLSQGVLLRRRVGGLRGTLGRHRLSSVTIGDVQGVPRGSCRLFGTHIVGGDLGLTSGCVALSGNSSSNVRSRVNIMSKGKVIKVICRASPSCSIIVSMLGDGSGVDYGVMKDSCFNCLG